MNMTFSLLLYTCRDHIYTQFDIHAYISINSNINASKLAKVRACNRDQNHLNHFNKPSSLFNLSLIICIASTSHFSFFVVAISVTNTIVDAFLVAFVIILIFFFPFFLYLNEFIFEWSWFLVG